MNKQQLEQYVKEVAGDDPDVATKMLEIFGSKPEVAERFGAGFLRHADYTKKAQEVANAKGNTDRVLNDYTVKLEQAEKRMKEIMQDAANDKISAATANARLQAVKKAYALSDDDIPTPTEVTDAANTGKVKKGVVDVDIDAKLDEFKKDFMKSVTEKLIPELSGMAALPIIWNSVNAEHQELTGKRLTKNEQADILKEAKEKGKSIEDVWAEKHDIPKHREAASDAVKRSKWKEEYDKEMTAKRSEEALSGGASRGGVEMVPDSQRSPLLRKKFDTYDAAGERNEPDKGRTAPQEKMSGADRAAANFIKRRSAGLKWGEQEKQAS